MWVGSPPGSMTRSSFSPLESLYTGEDEDEDDKPFNPGDVGDDDHDFDPGKLVTGLPEPELH
jgi:hypothetical protein